MPLLECSEVGFSYGSRSSRRVWEWLTGDPGEDASVFTSFDWTVAAGATTLLLGPNGAGKSTLLKLLAGQLTPLRGHVRIDGVVSRQKLYERVGWMPQSIKPVRGLTVHEQVQYSAWVGGSSTEESRSLASRALEIVNLTCEANSRADQLSGGQLRRLGLAQAWARPSATTLLLDEPTAGLDPAQSINFRELLGGLDCPGGIVISTHQVADLADHVDRIAVLSGGTMLFDGSVDAFRDRGGTLGVTSGSIGDVFMAMIDGGVH